MRFSETLQPIEVKNRSFLGNLMRPMGQQALRLAFETDQYRPDELTDAIESDIEARHMTLEDRPDPLQLERFWDGVVQDFRKDGIDYSDD